MYCHVYKHSYRFIAFDNKLKCAAGEIPIKLSQIIYSLNWLLCMNVCVHTPVGNRGKFSLKIELRPKSTCVSLFDEKRFLLIVSAFLFFWEWWIEMYHVQNILNSDITSICSIPSSRSRTHANANTAFFSPLNNLIETFARAYSLPTMQHRNALVMHMCGRISTILKLNFFNDTLCVFESI